MKTQRTNDNPAPMKNLKFAEFLGMKAYYAGLTRDESPYADSMCRAAGMWRIGWNKAQRSDARGR